MVPGGFFSLAFSRGTKMEAALVWAGISVLFLTVALFLLWHEVTKTRDMVTEIRMLLKEKKFNDQLFKELARNDDIKRRDDGHQLPGGPN
jgi:hypothetical protein